MKRVIAVSVFMLALGVSSFGVVIGDFEGSMDGWEMQNGATGTFSADGTTLGSSALQVGFGPNWIPVLKLSVLDKANDLDELQSISFDITTRNDAGQIPDWWLQMNIIFNTQTAGWNDSGNLYGGVPWDPRTDTLTWTVPQAIRDVIAASGPGDWAEILIVTNTSGAVNTMWVDNIQMQIPEPATLALLGLGGLSLIRRKR